MKGAVLGRTENNATLTRTENNATLTRTERNWSDLVQESPITPRAYLLLQDGGHFLLQTGNLIIIDEV